MSDFVISKQGQAKTKEKQMSLRSVIIKQHITTLKLLLLLGSYGAFVYLSVSNNNLFLKELLVVGGILSLIFIVHLFSNK